jgi:hypothetical protein
MILQTFSKLNENHNQDNSLFKVQLYTGQGEFQ